MISSVVECSLTIFIVRNKNNKVGSGGGEGRRNLRNELCEERGSRALGEVSVKLQVSVST